MLIDKTGLLGLGALVAIDEMRGRAAFVTLHKANEKSSLIVNLEMREIEKLSLIKGSPIRLQVFRSGERNFLRWKYNNLPITWEMLQPHLNDQAAPVRQHYIHIQRRVLELNAMSSMFQAVRGEIRKLLKQAGWPPITPLSPEKAQSTFTGQRRKPAAKAKTN